MPVKPQANFAIHENGTAYSGGPVVEERAAPFFENERSHHHRRRQLREPLDRHERLRDARLGITQEVRHVDGSRSLRLT